LAIRLKIRFCSSHTVRGHISLPRKQVVTELYQVKWVPCHHGLARPLAAAASRYGRQLAVDNRPIEHAVTESRKDDGPDWGDGYKVHNSTL
jgi:hypothetical protein